MARKGRPSLGEIALFGVLGALIYCAKAAFSWLPNIEPVSLLVMVYAAVFGRKALYPIYLYVFLECLLSGVGLWSIPYLYIWAVLAATARGLREMKSPFGWAALSGAFGLLFGALCAPVYLLAGGLRTAVGWWVAGLPYDAAHGAGNFVLALVLFIPLRNLLENCYKKMVRF